MCPDDPDLSLKIFTAHVSFHSPSVRDCSFRDPSSWFFFYKDYLVICKRNMLKIHLWQQTVEGSIPADDEKRDHSRTQSFVDIHVFPILFGLNCVWLITFLFFFAGLLLTATTMCLQSSKAKYYLLILSVYPLNGLALQKTHYHITDIRDYTAVIYVIDSNIHL